MMVAATPPIIIARTCWSFNQFLIARARLSARFVRAPNHRDALRAGQAQQHLRWREPEDGAARVAFDDVGPGAGLIRRGIGHCDPLRAFGYTEIGRDIIARADP